MKKLKIYLDSIDMPPIEQQTADAFWAIAYIKDNGVYVDDWDGRTWYPPHRIRKIVVLQKEDKHD